MVGFFQISERLFGCCCALTVVVPIVTVDAAQAGSESVLYSFRNNGSDGNAPGSNLIDVNGTLYGTTVVGGTSNEGTVFTINPSTSAESVLYSFQNDGADGNWPSGGLINVHGTLYGLTSWGGASDSGTVFSINPSTGTEAVLYSFRNNGADGYAPNAGLVELHGILYGTTLYGGTSGAGAIFSVNASTGAESVLHSFAAEDANGQEPLAGLTNVHGILYGTASIGGAYGGGVLFSIDPSTGAYSVVHPFGNGSDGNDPQGAMINVAGTLYGTTISGGTDTACGDSQGGCGTVFLLSTRTGTESVLYAFQNNGTDGDSPVAGVIDVHGTLYGTTLVGGTSNDGTVFSVKTSTGAERVLHSFKNNGTDGYGAYGGLIAAGHAMYGTTAEGGSQGEGTIFKIKR